MPGESFPNKQPWLGRGLPALAGSKKVSWAALEPLITGDLDSAILRVEHAHADLGWVINHPPAGMANPMRLDAAQHTLAELLGRLKQTKAYLSRIMQEG